MIRKELNHLSGSRVGKTLYRKPSWFYSKPRIRPKPSEKKMVSPSFLNFPEDSLKISRVCLKYFRYG